MKRIFFRRFVGAALAAAVFAGSLTMYGSQNVGAATKTLLDTWKDKTLTARKEVDLTGDGKAENVQIQISRLNEWNLDKLRIKVDGKTALLLKDIGFDVNVTYVKLPSGQQLLWVSDTCENDDANYDCLYQYDARSKKLKKAVVLESQMSEWTKGGFHIYSTYLRTYKDAVHIKYFGQLTAVGGVKWAYVYDYKDGAFSLKSPTAVVSGKWHEGDFTAKKKLVFLKEPGSSHTAFVLDKGETVELKKLTQYKNTYYIQCRYGKQTGWISADQGEIFEDVMLAG